MIIIESISDDRVVLDNGSTLMFNNILEIKIEEYDYAEGFNKLTKAKVIGAFFKGTLESSIHSN